MSLPEIMGVGELDPHCQKLLAVFMLEHETYRFNRFQELLEDMGLKITTPTLIMHLNHLADKQLIVRDEKDKKFVTYRFNWDKWPNIDELLKDRILGEKAFQKELDGFRTRPVIEQILYVLDVAVLVIFFSLRNSIIAKIKPETDFEATMNSIYFGHLFGRVEQMILDNVVKRGEEYTLECLQTIDRLTTQYTEARTKLGDLQKLNIPMILATEETMNLLQKIRAHLKENTKPGDQRPKPDILHAALEEYAKKIGIEK